MTEHHLISFDDGAGYDSYSADERRPAVRPLWIASRAVIQLDEVRRV